MGKKSKSGTDVLSFFDKIQSQVSAEAINTADDSAGGVAQLIYEKSQEYVPKDTGDLATSGRVEKVDVGRYKIVYDSEYSFYVHENMRRDAPFDARNGPALYGAEGNAKEYTDSSPGIGPKYLERAADEVGSTEEITRYLRDALGRFKRKVKV